MGSILDAYTTAAYACTDFQPSGILLTGNFADHGEDTNGNGLYDVLVVDMELLINQSNTYYFNTRLVDANGEEIVWAAHTQYLTPGTQWVSLQFDGRYIYGNGVDGPYDVKDLSIYSGSQSFTQIDVYTTSAYAWNAFEPAGVVSGIATAGGQPVPNANIFISGVDSDLTDSNGAYRLTVLNSGTYIINIDADPNLSPWQIWVNGTKVAEGTSATIDVVVGEVTEVNFISTIAERGTIIVEKQTDPDGAAGSFTFTSDAAGIISDGQQIVVADLAPGTYTATEDDPTGMGFNLSNVTCDDGNSTGDAGTRTATFNLEAGETVKCTFTNTQIKQGTIIVEKQTDPDGDPTSFTFTGDAAGSIKDGEQIVVSDLLPGTYSSQEIVPAGWELTSISCDDANSTGDVGTGKATFNLEAGETVKCTFSNKLKRGTIIVEKQTDPDGAAGSFTFSGHAAGSISDGGTIVVSNLLPGTYTSTEADPSPQFELTNISCNDANSTRSLNQRKATFNLEAGETVKCTFTNAQRSLQVSKTTLWPVGGLAGVGQEVRYLITIENNGGVTVDPLTLRDEYNPWCLKSRKAEVPPDVHGGSAGFLQWNDLGALAPGETKTLWVEFVASHACEMAPNKAIVQTGGLTFQDEATLRILETVARIGGRLFHDETAAGVHLPGTRGVENGQASTNGLVYTTNTSGWYSFNLLDPGTYSVMSAPPAGSWWTPTTSETCAATVSSTWDDLRCDFGYWWGLNGPPLDGLAAQQQVTLAPVQDTVISGVEPGNHGFEENLWVRQPGLSSTLVQFDLSGLPAGAQIVWVKLRLYGATASNPDNRLYMTAYPLSKMWTEGGATWSEAAAGLPWDEAGAAGAGDHGAPVGWAWTNTLGWVEFDLDPALVAAWLADAGSNHGLLLRGEGSENRRVAYWFLSQEHGNGAAHPQLVIGYNLP